MTRVLTHNVSVEFVDCAACGMVFGVTSEYLQRRRADGNIFHCPQGHTNHYRENEHDKTRRERDMLRQRLAQRDDEIADQRRRREATERALAAQKGVTTKLRKRASAGVCPCCTRSFSNMARHMATKHPTFKAEEAERTLT